MKKTLAIILFIVMLVSVGLYSYAAETNGTITVNNTVENQKYSIYEIFKLEGYNSTNNAYTYSIDSTSAWYEFVTTGEGKDYITITTQSGINYVTWKDGVDTSLAPEFAKKALAYAKEKSITPTATKTVGKPAASVNFNNLELGYYLVDSSLGALCILNTTAPDATVEEKNATPTVEKTVKEGSDYSEKNDAEIGATVEFKTVIHAKKGAENYVLHDKMSGLTLTPNSVVVKDGVTTLTADTDYTIVTNGVTDGCQFEITFNESFLKNITADKDITIEYSATVNSDAVIASEGNANETWLKYGDELDTNVTEKDITKTYVWNFDIFKFTSKNSTEVALEGAEFVISNAEGNFAIVANGKLTGWTATKADATTLISGADGKIHISGLDSGNYTLEETKAPDGYNKLTGTVSIVINNEGVVTANESATTDKIVKVENKTGALLPSTGGIGTKVFYIVGGILFVGAIVFIIVRKRMNIEE